MVTPPGAAPTVVADCAAAGVPRVWLHRGIGPGYSSDDAVAACRQHGIAVIPGGCPNVFGATSDLGHRGMLRVLQGPGSFRATSLGLSRQAGDVTLVGMYVIGLAGRLADVVEPFRVLSAFRYYGSAIQHGLDLSHIAVLTLAAFGLAAIGAQLFERRDILR